MPGFILKMKKRCKHIRAYSVSSSLNKGKGNLYLKSKTNAIGVFYEKEKSVALFYDFERFEELSLGGQNDEWKNYY